ncbi:hypothetical protein LSH36_34g04084 [Paralvinella palmiformis]|uniref:Protein sleepless n=1 Tax=Paralvinella palmiformis TaxID=53620 RepID=A0AAD9K860_9ANNE|nr:hypothetical protein LSH36_34g04084 [Paralvinella palmiformis]
METWKVSVFVLGVVLLIGVRSVFSIKCYVCNSGYKYAGEDCLDIKKLKGGDYLKECADEEIKDRVPNGTYKYCRLFSQTVNGDHRLTRQCASGGRTDKCIERTGTKGISLNYCHCNVDGCNSASTLCNPITLMVTMVISVWMLLQRT